MPKDYQNGKIYKIYCLTGGNEDVYYGSTTQPLSKRMGEHRSYYKTYNSSNTSGSNYTSRLLFEKFEVDNCIIELVENYPCNTVEELRAREGYYQLNNPCVNKQIAGRSKSDSDKASYEEHKEYRKEYCKKWCEKNKEKLSKNKKEYYEKNKEEIKKKAQTQYTCDKCNIEASVRCKARHERTKKHQSNCITTGV